MNRKQGHRTISGKTSFEALMREFPLRPIRSDGEYDRAAAVLDRFAVRAEGTLGRDEQDYFEMLTLLVDDYDKRLHTFDTSKVTPVSMLRFLLEQRGMSTADLGRLLNNRGLASLLVNGKRELSKSHIAMLSDFFDVSPAVFFAAPKRKTA